MGSKLLKIVRFILSIPLWLAAIFCVIVGLFPTDTENTRRSLENQQAIYSDMKKMGEFTEEYRNQNAHPPNTEQLLEWMIKQNFNYIWFDKYKDDPDPSRLSLAISARNEAFILGQDSSLPESSDHTYRISYWNNWTDEYAPETGVHTFATSLDDYGPVIWQRVLILMLAIGLAALGYVVGLRRKASMESHSL